MHRLSWKKAMGAMKRVATKCLSVMKTRLFMPSCIAFLIMMFIAARAMSTTSIVSAGLQFHSINDDCCLQWMPWASTAREYLSWCKCNTK